MNPGVGHTSPRAAEANNAPIFVVGHQRSGTTLLQSLLGAHSRIAAPPEMHFIFRVSRLGPSYGDLNDDTNLRRALHDALSPTIPLLVDCGFDEDVLFERLRATERTFRDVLDVIMSDFAARQGKARWSEKSPGQAARHVLGLFPDAQVLHIVRDPREVIASSLETPWNSSGARQRALRWRTFTRENVVTGMRAGPARFFQLRYEDLVRDPHTMLRLICAFLGEEFEPAMVDDPSRRQTAIPTVAAPWQAKALEPITPATGLWAKRLTRFQRAEIAAVLDRELPTLGYQPDRPIFNRIGSVMALAPRPHAIRFWIADTRHRLGVGTPIDAYEAFRQHEQWASERVLAAQPDAAPPPR